MPGSISTAFTITHDEYIRAMRRYYKTKLQVKRDLLGGVIAISCGVYLLNTIETVTLAWFSIVAGVVLCLATTSFPQSHCLNKMDTERYWLPQVKDTQIVESRYGNASKRCGG